MANDAEAFDAFFGDECVPGTGALETDDTAVWPGLCEACPDQCSEESPYEGYFGAMRGLVDGICEVAFVKHTTPEDFIEATENAALNLNANDFRYFCPNGGCEEIIGSAPSADCVEG